MEKFKVIDNCEQCNSQNLLDRYNGGKYKDEYNGYRCTDCDHEFYPQSEGTKQ